ncbi:unnamed protein product [Parnassius mnemosyne]|uniref:Ig-like domain-containing protein n=1 Tax=Parnassius mnemosyne TaxID=213953 RepID=A0AAV1LHJ4_9NEOP
MFYIVLLFAAAALLSGGCRSANVNKHMKLLEIDNNIGFNLQSRQASRKFLTLMKKPNPMTVNPTGAPLELTCDAVGAPAPSVHWFKNDAPIYEHDLESNEVIDANPTSLARVTSTLLVPRTEGKVEYSCVVVAGSNTLRASTIVYSTNGSTDFAERSKLTPLAPRILVTYKVFVDSIGNNVVLPCRVKGHPRPKIAWRDNGGRPVGRDPRMKVLRSGELVISSLRWSDMGEFICHATNMFGSQLAKTFVYPARAE